MATTLNIALAVWLMIILNVLDWIYALLWFSGVITQDTSVVIAALGLPYIGVIVVLLLYVQGNLNRYWASLTDHRAINARIGVGEVIFGLIGILS
ncbi:MAG: hypothetical protein EXR55_04670 [Dehalococcoidia bacterium]|nr:hypothetical protein [Dehalococcoidia bacterium]